MPTPDNPWRDLTTPQSRSALCTRRVDKNSPWGFFWGRNSQGDLLFILRHEGPPLGKDKLPCPRGIEFSDGLDPDSAECVLVARLEDAGNRDIFAQLCWDIVSATRAASSSSDALRMALRRTWRWHHLLRGGNDGLLSKEQQKGLIGELHFLSDVLVPALGCAAAVRAWRGPYGSSQDFVFSDSAAEVKSKRSSGPQSVKISSAEQLDVLAGSRLFLFVANVDEALDSGRAGDSLDTFAMRALAVAESEAPESLADLEDALTAAGYERGDQYRGIEWHIGDTMSYEILEGFPRIAASALAHGIERVSYSVNLNACSQFAVPVAAVLSAAHGGE